MRSSFIFIAASALFSGVLAQSKPTFPFNKQPYKWESGQSGHNNCGEKDSPDAKCQTVVLNGVDDFCLWGATKPNSGVGDVEASVVAWCNKAGHGARLMPKGAIKSVRILETPGYVTFTGLADLSKIDINGNKDGGGELDPHGADGTGNPKGGLVYSSLLSNDGSIVQSKEWHTFLENDRFCFRMCKPDFGDARKYCPHVYDEQGCDFNDPAPYDKQISVCKGDLGQAPGVYGSSTWYQGVNPTPAAHPAPKSSQCTKYSSIHFDTYGKAKSTSSRLATSTKKTTTKKSSTHKPKKTSTKRSSSKPTATGK